MGRFSGAELAKLQARVHPGGVRPSAGPVTASAAEREQARQWALQRPVTASARPVQDDDDGKALVARRLRETRARLKDAKRRGDQKHALRLAQMARELQEDAAAVDYGRPSVTASARPGKLACGHLLAAGCGCPRRSSSRGRR